MNYTTLATTEQVEKTISALKQNGIEAITVENGRQALDWIKTHIPEGASIMNGSSTTLKEIGFIDYLKSDSHKWDNLHAKTLSQQDPKVQAQFRKQATLSDYYVGSTHAVTEDGQMVFGSNSGSQLSHVVYSSPNLIFVVSTQKIVKDLNTAMERLEKHVVPLEDERMNKAYGFGTTLSKVLIFRKENLMMGRKVHILLVNEKLGF